MAYYHNLITEKSWLELQNLKKQFKFALIGGWAIWLYSKKLKSKDIDILIDFSELSILNKIYKLYKNDRLSKYEAVRQEIQIDIYLPHYSRIGIPVEELLKQVVEKDGFIVVNPDYLFALKLYSLSQRGRSPKGRKDLLDLISLIMTKSVDFNQVKRIIDEFNLTNSLTNFQEFLEETGTLEEIDLNLHQFAKIKKEIRSMFFSA